MALEDIERLKEKLSKDPDSKLFIVLAEEYHKAGMVEEAIDVLTKGLEKHPGYMSARVCLGKIYIERNLLDEARIELEKVISAIPDNLYAHKKLAEIYRDLGEKDKAIKEFKTVLKLNPLDEFSAASLAAIEEPKLHPQEPSAEEPLIKLQSAIETVEERSSEIPAAEEDTETWEQQPITEEPKFEQEPLMEIEEEKLPEIPVAEENTEKWVHEEGEEIVTEAEEVTEKDVFSFESVFKNSEIAVEEEEFLKEGEVFEQPTLNISDADPYILQGKYMEAINIYRRLLSIEPGNTHVMQRIEELKALLKLLGKDKEELIARLNSLLDGIKKRRDEFFGSS